MTGHKVTFNLLWPFAVGHLACGGCCVQGCIADDCSRCFLKRFKVAYGVVEFAVALYSDIAPCLATHQARDAAGAQIGYIFCGFFNQTCENFAIGLIRPPIFPVRAFTRVADRNP